MTRNEWQMRRSDGGSLKRFLRGREVMVHKSCDVAMLPDPLNPNGPRVIPWVQKPGITRKLA